MSQGIITSLFHLYVQLYRTGESLLYVARETLPRPEHLKLVMMETKKDAGCRSLQKVASARAQPCLFSCANQDIHRYMSQNGAFSMAVVAMGDCKEQSRETTRNRRPVRTP